MSQSQKSESVKTVVKGKSRDHEIYQPNQSTWLNPQPPQGGSGLPSKPPGNADNGNTAQQTSTPASSKVMTVKIED
ncbi:MAG: hypothetical protein IH874_02855 [Candidatus Dadabacteria bacterium]|nr:hypothetical protein [Candidatus Dadabacteria bacterium]